MHISEKEISLYLDNMLDSERRKKLEEHISVCQKCSSTLNEWKSLYFLLGQLGTEFELDGLESKVMRKIKKRQPENPAGREKLKIPVPALVFASLIVLMLNLFFEQVIGFMNKFYSNTLAFVLDESLEFINTAKWEALDLIEMFRTMEMTGLAACIILIAGGIYYAVNRKSVRKV